MLLQVYHKTQISKYRTTKEKLKKKKKKDINLQKSETYIAIKALECVTQQKGSTGKIREHLLVAQKVNRND